MMKYISAGSIMIAGVAISAALANEPPGQAIRSEAGPLLPASAGIEQRTALQGTIFKINSETVEKFTDVDQELRSGNRNTGLIDLETRSADEDVSVGLVNMDPVAEADQFSTLSTNPDGWVVITYPVASNRQVQLRDRLGTIPVANVGDAERKLLPAIYQFTQVSENNSYTDEVSVEMNSAVRYTF